MFKKLLNWGIGILTVILIYLVMFVVPPAKGMGEAVRIVFFHVPMAWLAVVAFVMNDYWGAMYLKAKDMRKDYLSGKSAQLGMVFVLLACASGAVFSKLTWGAYWNWDHRQTTILVLILIYGAYLTLRSAINDEQKRARITAVYSLFSCLTVPFLVFIIPRLYFSLHPSPLINSGGSVDMEPVMLMTLLLGVLDATLLYVRLLLGGKNE